MVTTEVIALLAVLEATPLTQAQGMTPQMAAPVMTQSTSETAMIVPSVALALTQLTAAKALTV
jgi:hypothetical protein